MSNASTSSLTKREVYEAYRTGELSEEDVAEFFGDEWENVRQLSRVADVLDDQPDVGGDELYR